MSDSAEHTVAISQKPRDLGVKDIDNRELDRMCRRIVHVAGRELQTSVESIHVMGSFARGDARRVFSDLDIRVVVQGYAPEDDRDRVETLLKNEEGPDIVPEACGYLDAHVTPMIPTDEEPSKEVWSR